MRPSSRRPGERGRARRGLLVPAVLLGVAGLLSPPAGAQSFHDDLQGVLASLADHGREAAAAQGEADDPEQAAPFSEARLLAVGAIRLYQFTLSETDTQACTFYPSCSHFGMASLHRYGVLKGGLLTADRLTRCHGFPTMAAHYHVHRPTGRFADPIEAYAHE